MMTTNEGNSEVKSLPLGDTHVEVGARLMPVCGWSLPAHFGDPEREYEAAAERVALMDASYVTIISAAGRDVLDYLNRRLSQRVIDMQPGDGLRATQLDADGRMEADLEVFRATPDMVLLIAPPGVPGPYLQALADKYVFTEDARFEDQTDRWATFAVVGPRRWDALRGAGLPAFKDGARIVPLPQTASFRGYALTSEFFPDAVLIMVPQEATEKIHAALKAQVQMLDGRLLGFLAFDTLRVETGVPWYGIDLTPRSIPLEADLFSAVHTNKGCYPGQETIAKILNLGHPARKMVGVLWESEDPPPAGSPLSVNGQEAGRLTSSTFSPRLGRAIGLAFVRWQHREAGTRLTAPDGTAGTVVELPFSGG